MVMKDKLIKNNHFGLYYKLRNFAIGFVAFSCLAIAIAVPTYISIQNSQQSVKAEGDSQEEQNDGLEGIETFEDQWYSPNLFTPVKLLPSDNFTT